MPKAKVISINSKKYKKDMKANNLLPAGLYLTSPENPVASQQLMTNPAGAYLLQPTAILPGQNIGEVDEMPQAGTASIPTSTTTDALTPSPQPFNWLWIVLLVLAVLAIWYILKHKKEYAKILTTTA